MNNFKSFFEQAVNIANDICKIYPNNKITTQLIDEYSNTKSTYSLGYLPQNIQLLLNSYTSELKISLTNLVKNIAKHPEIDINTIENTLELIKKAKNVKLTNDKVIIELFENNNYYQIVIKTTKNKTENFLLSVHKSNHKKR